MACLLPDEANKYLCFQNEPQSEAVLGPYVIIFLGGGLVLTNSNVGFDLRNAKACIKSFQFGRSVANGTGFKIEIITEEYTTMMKIINELNKTKNLANKDAHRVECQFGWVKRSCNNSVRLISNINYGGSLLYLVQTVESNFENGVYKLNVECCDLFQRTNQQTQGWNQFGQDDNKMPLKTALRKIWTSPTFHPNVDEVQFKAFNNNEKVPAGPNFDFKAADGGPLGPKNTWQTKEKNKLSTTREWINPVLTTNDRGIIQIYDNEDQLSLVWQEDVIDKNPNGCARRQMGTFVVNGGNCTPVISFSPKINWLTQLTGTGAVNSGATSVAGKRADNTLYNRPDWSGREQLGTNQTEGPATDQKLYRPMSIQNEATQDSAHEHSHATHMYEIAGSIEAELTIQGNPKFAYNYGPGGIVGKYMSIIVLNPAVIRESSDTCVWLAESPVNEVLSNSGWLVKGVDHQITDGKYVTTFKVLLAAPNAELNAGDNLGATSDGFSVERIDVALGDIP